MKQNGRIHAIIVADKVKGSSEEAIIRIIRGFNTPQFHAVSLVVFGSRALPLVEAGTAEEAARAYYEIPRLPGRPEPAAGLVEAWDLASEYRLPGLEPVVVLVWSAHVRPRVSMRIAEILYEASGLPVATVLARPSPPGWLRYNPPPRGEYLTYRSNMNPQRLAERLAAMALESLEARARSS